MTPKVLVWFYMFASAFIAFTYAKLRIVATEACGTANCFLLTDFRRFCVHGYLGLQSTGLDQLDHNFNQ